MTVGTQIENPPRLPKQLKHWFAQAGIYPGRFSRDWRRRNWFYGTSCAKGFTAGCPSRRRHFRVIPHLDRMDICDGDMDRWANSMGASVSPIPRTEADFKKAIATLVKKATRAMRDSHDT